MADVESKLVTPGGDTVVLKPESIPAAKPSGKGGVLQGGGSAKVPWTTAISVARHPDTYRINDVIQGLRDSGTLANDKFIVVYDMNITSEQYYDEDFGGEIEDNTVYEQGDTATVYWEDPEEAKDIPYLTGYEFKGWATSPDAVVPTYPYDENDPQTYTITITDHDVILYAVWQMRTCTLTYSLGDYGTGSVPAAQTVQEDAEVDIAFSPAPTVNDGSGRIFTGWDLTDGGNTISDALYTADGAHRIHLYADTTLYPVFVDQYTLTYALGNDATGTVPAAETYWCGETVNINFNQSVTCVSDNTKVFVGWSETDKDTTATYTANGTNSIYRNKSVTLYPVFAAQGQGGSITIINQSSKGYTIDVYQGGSSVLQIASGSQETFNYSPAIEYEIHTILTHAVYDGVYDGTQYSNRTLQYVGNKIYNPKTNVQNWEFADGDSGTLTIS